MEHMVVRLIELVFEAGLGLNPGAESRVHLLQRLRGLDDGDMPGLQEVGGGGGKPALDDAVEVCLLQRPLLIRADAAAVQNGLKNVLCHNNTS